MTTHSQTTKQTSSESAAPSRPLLRAASRLKWGDGSYSLHPFRPMAAMLKHRLPAVSVWKCGTGTGRTVTSSLLGWLLAAAIDALDVTYALPRKWNADELLREGLLPFQHGNPRAFSLYQDGTGGAALPGFTLSNGSSIALAPLLDHPDLTRGHAADLLILDDLQRLHGQALAAAENSLAGSEGNSIQAMGVPTGTHAVLQEAWDRSSQAEWVVPCGNAGCGHNNVPSLEADLPDMLGEEGLVCAECGRPIDADDPEAAWVHGRPKRRARVPGYHVPRIILPYYTDDAERWQEIVEARRELPEQEFVPRYLGEPVENGNRLLSEDDLQVACAPEHDGITDDEGYELVVMGVRWGKTSLSEAASGTACAVMGKRRGESSFDVLDYHVFSDSATSREQVGQMGDLFSRHRCDHLLYSGGTGPGMEYRLAAGGTIPANNRIEVVYTSGGDGTMSWNESAGRYELDRPTSLMLLAKAIKDGTVRLPPSFRSGGAASHLLALRGPRSQDSGDGVHIGRESHQRAGLAHAMNYTFSGFLYACGGFEAIRDSNGHRFGGVL